MIKRLLYKYLLQFIPDILWIKVRFRVKLGYWPNLKSPQTYNEKLQWLKLHNKNPLYTQLVDKIEVRNYIKEKIGSEYLVPLLGTWNSFDDIDFDKLPNQFVLKTNHDSGGLVICQNKNKLDLNKVKRKLTESLKFNYYWALREWPYKNVKPRILCEKFLNEDNEECLTDYKFFCFNGIPKIMYISKDRAAQPTTDFFDMDFNHLNIRMKDPNSKIIPQKPQNFDKMKALATILAKDKPHIRVDFFCIHDKIYAGELTFFHMSGFSHIYPIEWEKTLGSWISLNV